mgnify:CR=1 FL=1
MTMALIKLAEEDPTFKTYTDQEKMMAISTAKASRSI